MTAALDFVELEQDLKILDTWGGDQKQIEEKHGAPLWELRRALKFSKPAPAPTVEVADVQPLTVCSHFSCGNAKAPCSYCGTKVSTSCENCPHCGYPMKAKILNAK